MNSRERARTRIQDKDWEKSMRDHAISGGMANRKQVHWASSLAILCVWATLLPSANVLAVEPGVADAICAADVCGSCADGSDVTGKDNHRRTALVCRLAGGLGDTGVPTREAAEVAKVKRTRRIALIDDTSFRRGFDVLSPTPGKRVLVGRLRPFTNVAPPVWQLAQWSSRFDMACAKRETIGPKQVRFFDGAESVLFDYRSATAPILTLGLDGVKEYQGNAPAPGTPWPHLLIERRFLLHPRLTDLSAVDIRISYRLTHHEVTKPAGFDPQRHTAQFLLYITIQNQNKNSAGFGDYLWFGVPMYDARYRHTRSHKTADLGKGDKHGTGKFIFNPAGTRYTRQCAQDGHWITIKKDLLPLMKEALQDAWKKGFLRDSHDPADYGLGGMNCGWEVTGTWNVAMQIKGLRLDVSRKSMAPRTR